MYSVVHFPQQKAISPEEVLSKRVICEPLTIAMSAPTGDGGAAVVLCSEDFVLRHHLEVYSRINDCLANIKA